MRKAQSDINKTDAQAQQAQADAIKTMGEARTNALQTEMQTQYLTQEPGL